MTQLAPGVAAPPIEGLHFRAEPMALFFYKVTCPVCRMAAPKASALHDAYPGRIVGVGEDPPAKLAQFGRELGVGFDSVPDPPPYAASTAYGLETVPSLFVIDSNGIIVESVESWDRRGYNRASATLANLIGLAYVEVSNEHDGLPAFRPG